jgi:hypothetical protein
MAGHGCTKEKAIESIAKAQIESDKRDVLQANQIEMLQKDIGEVKIDIKTILLKIEGLENKFASKWAEWVIK